MGQGQVTRGARTTQNTQAQKSHAKAAYDPSNFTAGDADRLVDELEGEKPPAAVVYVADGAGHGYVYPPRSRYNSHGDEIDGDPGLYYDFQGIDATRPYNLDNPQDAEFVERMDKWLKSGDPRIKQFSIRKLEPNQPAPPFQRWDGMDALGISYAVGANLGDDHDANVRYVKECARYEIEVGPNRREVLAMLDGLLATEAAQGDAFEVEVKLS